MQIPINDDFLLLSLVANDGNHFELPSYNMAGLDDPYQITIWYGHLK